MTTQRETHRKHLQSQLRAVEARLQIAEASGSQQAVQRLVEDRERLVKLLGWAA